MARFEFRLSQGIVPFGVGAIVDFPETSLMAAGLDVWPVEAVSDPDLRAAIRGASRILDTRLQARLSFGRGRPVRCFFSPLEAPEVGGFADAASDIKPRGVMPFVRFPRWHFCPRCRLLWDVPAVATGEESETLIRCNGAIRRSESKAELCCDRKRKEKLQPVRFVVACEAGHIMDFPWKEWVHVDSSNPGCAGGSGSLFIVATGAAGLQGVRVECARCGAKRTLGGAFGRGAFDKIWRGCPGGQPWLGRESVSSSCSQQHPRAVQRGAANVYFASVISSILIPPYSERIRQILDDPGTWEVIEELPRVDGRLKRGAYIRNLAEKHGQEPEVLAEAADRKLSGDAEATDAVDEGSYRFTEYRAFIGSRPPVSERHDFDIKRFCLEEYAPRFREFFERVVLLPRLRETRALVGFSRLIPRFEIGELAPLSRRELDWLPGHAIRGEGIFLELNADRLDRWDHDTNKFDLHMRGLRDRHGQSQLSRSATQEGLHHRFVLVHTLAHLLIRQLAFDCGYDASSLAERLYFSAEDSTKMCGLLIYTASGDSEGTLGGLVRQGEPGRLELTFRAAIQNARMCSSDPLCAESRGQGLGGLNLAACHACALLPETACEEGNMLLDRSLLIESSEVPELGYFANLG